MKVSLSPEMERLVQEKIASGSYSSPGEVVQEALRLLHQQDELDRLRLEELKREIAVGLQAAERGAVVPAEEVFRELRERNASLTKRKK